MCVCVCECVCVCVFVCVCACACAKYIVYMVFLLYLKVREKPIHSMCDM